MPRKSTTDSNQAPQKHLDSQGDIVVPIQQVYLRGGGGCGPTTTSATTFETYKDFTKYLSGRKCLDCNNGLIKDAKDVQALFQRWQKGECSVSSQVKCRKCSKSTCIACFDGQKSKTTEVKIQGVRVKWCCSRGRLFMIWVILCGFDQQYSAEKHKEVSTKSTTYRTKGSGTGYGGIGNFGFDSYNNNKQAEAHSAEKKADAFDATMLEFLTKLLPSPDENTSFDVNPPEAVVSMLSSSKILNKAAELLRNDSLDDASKRKGLYDALLGFLRTIGTHKVIKRAMFSERETFPDAVNLFTLSFNGTPQDARKGSGPSLADLLRNLNLQSNVMMKGAQNNKKEFNDQDGKDLLWLCRKISDLSSYLLGKNQNPALPKDCGIIEVADENIYPTYYYYRNVQRLQDSPFGRVKSLITEITTLKTGLSSGIFVKHGSSRLDVMKAVIVGPEGTPYEYGLHEFDIFCPRQYPNVPPKVWFKGTNNGTVPINPNLHPNGEVCLSLLGTYPGEPWRPGKSTILQVLISIQAMIFCENPLRNDPSHEAIDDQSNQIYNQIVHVYTAKLALLDWARNPPSLWKDVARLHFEKNGDNILRKVEQWAVELYADRLDMGRKYGKSEEGIYVVLPKLQTALENYGATYKTRSSSTSSGGGSGVFDGGRSGYGSYDSSRKGC
ncbi:hypothetical protein P280DRAFT_539388 [Massarina eburnea CBS 473.64]|uniref:UBC core domain-containing protein n=1 Tax=Massarina eburnea CBS 473.64 TaxID=1395130 RepID=A0A6A6S672_9PLEO|nr:hypothetical protein P280DRAFT_539388 [Massarina eburnea CBS 473.64]